MTNPAVDDPPGLRDRDSGAAMDTRTHIHLDGCVEGVRVLFAVEGLDVAMPLTIGVVDDPGFFALA